MCVKPFIKWVGGKTQLLDNISKKYPAELGKSINKYCEPFIGGGAVLFDILSKYNLTEIMINDINPELINTYIQIRDNVHNLIVKLKTLQEMYWKYDSAQRWDYFYKQRERFNKIKFINNDKYNLEKASIFIFLNKTCFNGLYRVNKSGLFNVPMGNYKKPLICNQTNLLAISELLQNVIIRCGDYKECIDFIDKNTFVYIDPPYRPITKTSSFTSYMQQSFEDKQQIELGEFVLSINDKGAKVIVSNSDPKNTDASDEFFDELYSSLIIDRVNAKRVINCNGKNRGEISELLISNY